MRRFLRGLRAREGGDGLAPITGFIAGNQLGAGRPFLGVRNVGGVVLHRMKCARAHRALDDAIYPIFGQPAG
jgi:hypothetical protein